MRISKMFVPVFAGTTLALAFSGTARADDAPAWGLHGFGDVSVKNDYITPRGLVVTDKGTTTQILDGLVLVSPGGVAFTAGTWTDLNPGFKDNNISALNEFDFFFGVSARVLPRVEAGVQYVQFVSGQPSVAFHDERNIEFSVKYHDGAKGAPFTINPYAKFFWAVDGDSTVVTGHHGKTFDIELGAGPAYSTPDFTLSAPTWITLGPTSFWSRTDTGGNAGVFSTGLKGSVPLKFVKKGAGASAYLQVQYYHLINDNLVTAESILTSGVPKRDKCVFGGGISFGF